MENYDPNVHTMYSDFNDYGVVLNANSANMENDLNWNTVTWPSVPDIPGLTDQIKAQISSRFPPLADD